MSVFPAIRIEGGLLGPDILDQVLAGDLPGQKPADFGLDGQRSLTNEIAAAFADARAQWEVFRHRLERLPDTDPATTVTRDAWMIPFLSLLGYELRYNPRAYEVEGLTFAISHRAGAAEEAPPVHIVGARQELGRVPPTGRPRLAPHSLVQEFLNRTEHLWGIVTNGRTLRLLRDSTYVRRQAYIEFDLVQILEEQRFNDFSALFRLLHRTRLPGTIADARECFLEQYYQRALEQGGRVRERLRDGVEKCLQRLANGFLSHPANARLRQQVSSQASEPSHLTPEDLYRQLLRLVYRFLFLLVSEDRGLISADPLYREHYGVGRLRRLLDRRSAYSEGEDLWCSLRVLWKVLSDERLANLLGAAPLNGELFEPMDLDACWITNRDLLEAFWHLGYYRDTPSSPPRRVNYAALDVEELGSVYESLLEYRPQIDCSGTVPRFELAYGSERKSTGSYYTPPELVAELVRSALEPVLTERLEAAKRKANSEWRMVPESIRRQFVREVLPSLPGFGSLATGDAGRQTDLRTHAEIPASGTLRDDQSDAPGGNLDPGEHRRGMGTPLHGRIHPLSPSSQWQSHRIGDPAHPRQRSEPLSSEGDPVASGRAPDSGEVAQQPGAQPTTEKALAVAWSSTPFALRYSLFASDALLSIRVCDPACGSGHFLLAAARRLGKELARIRTGEDEPAPERVREAIRDVVAHCIYGVDKNPLAVELCRVALWLEAHCEGKPLTFLDHRIRCGDSLVGVMDLDVLEQGIPDEAFTPASGDDKAVATALKKRNRHERRDLESGQLSLPWHPAEVLPALSAHAKELSAIGDASPAEVRRKKELYERHHHNPERLKLAQACNLWTAAFFQRMEKGTERAWTTVTTRVVREALDGRAHPQALAAAEAMALQHRFFHWPLEFPEVFADGGFDVVLGNPPFMGGLKISGNFGPCYRNWLETVFAPFKGTADLCAAFYRRAFALLGPGGRLGMVATNTIGQGDTRESGLAVILGQSGAITFTRRFIKWPGAANVEVNLIAVHKRAGSDDHRRDQPLLDGEPVPFISSRLDVEPEGEPKRLPQNEAQAFIGDYVRGIGFVLEPDQAEALLTKNPRNADCLFPYLNGEDLNSDPEQKPSRWVICFHDWPLERAQQYPELLNIVEELVKPERQKLRDDVSGYARLKQQWWLYAAYAQAMRRAIAPLRRVLARAEVGQMHSVAFVPKNWIYSHMLIVFAFDDDYHFALLQSAVHETWLRKQASSLRTDIRYTPTDCFDTFPFPAAEYAVPHREHLLAQPAFARAAHIGAQYHEHRRQVMLARGLGLTKTYNLFHNPAVNDPDIAHLRQLHAEMDNIILACYGWDDLALKHDFYPNDRGQTRFMPSAEARRELIFRLLELNAKMAEEER